jgi:hypothetical protein
MGNLKETIEAIEKAKNNVPQLDETEYQRFFQKPPTVDTYYYSDAPGSSKHQNTRKPKSRKNVKHGNRKKK